MGGGGGGYENVVGFKVVRMECKVNGNSQTFEIVNILMANRNF